YGFRNPWRFSFDAASGDIFIGDVGEVSWEEVDVLPAGQKGWDFGWNIMEGTHCLNDPTESCDRTGKVLPVSVYDHSGGACAITGGYVYRGCAIPELYGRYIYADYCAGVVKSFVYQNGQATDPQDLTPILDPTGNDPPSQVGGF